MARQRWIALFSGLLILLGAVLAAPPAASAVTDTGCIGTGCDGKDPLHSFNSSSGIYCSAGAWTVVSNNNALGGLLEERWGPNCQTNWTRFTPRNNDTYEIWVTRLSDGVWAGNGLFHSYVFSGNGVSHYGDQVYAPGAADSCVRDITTNSQDVCVHSN